MEIGGHTYPFCLIIRARLFKQCGMFVPPYSLLFLPNYLFNLGLSVFILLSCVQDVHNTYSYENLPWFDDMCSVCTIELYATIFGAVVCG